MSPLASVIVPVRDREQLLGRLLAALDRQTDDRFEVVVVDDASSDGSRLVAERAVVRGRPVRVLTSGGRGAVTARSIGVAATTSPFVLFTDSDCEPEPSWVGALLDALEQGADVAHGTTSPTRRPRPLERTLWSGHDGLFPTCNIAYRRRAFEAAGGFDVAARRRLGFRPTNRANGLGFGEDTLLAWRVADAGGVVVHVDGAEVRHHVFPPDLRDALSRSVMCAAFPGLVREVPELRRTVCRARVFLGRATRAPLYAAATSAALRRPGPAAVGAAVWLGAEWRWLRRSSDGSDAARARAFPATAALDAVVAAALVVGSIRHRRLVL